MGAFDFFRKKKENRVEEEINDILEVKEIDEFDVVENENNNEEFNYNFIVSNEEEYHNKENLTKEEINRLIVSEILKVVDKSTAFNSMEIAALEAAKTIGIENIDDLTVYLHERIAKPHFMNGRYDGLGEWRMAIENAVLTILYAFKQYGVDELLKIANECNNNSIKCVNLLCKLAENNIETEKIVDSIIYIMKNYKEEFVVKTLNFLSQVKGNDKIIKVLQVYNKKYIYDKNIEGAYDTTLNLINVTGTFTKEQLVFLKAIALSDNKIKSTLILRNEDGNVDLSGVTEELRLKAALTFYSLHNKDEQINAKLMYLRDNSLDLDLRKYLNDILK